MPSLRDFSGFDDLLEGAFGEGAMDGGPHFDLNSAFGLAARPAQAPPARPLFAFAPAA